MLMAPPPSAALAPANPMPAKPVGGYAPGMPALSPSPTAQQMQLAHLIKLLRTGGMK